MAVLKCKMCGGELDFTEGASTAECEYCGSVQTIPKVDDKKKLTLFARANRLRAACEFDKAAGIYETIVADFPEEAEAYWGLVLCKYGIEYVDDPATGKKIPTCHRSSFESIMEDSDFEQTLENADIVARKVYREEAKQIEEIRKGIVAVSNNEQPYDIFICYKETDENGNRTLDSVLAQDVYDALTDKGYRVFFSRITLEDKLGLEYEPYIFAALNSAKIMLAFGTDYEYFNAVWVKNEWGRYLKLMAQDKKKHLIPCYKGIDAYDMPQEFARLQAQDLGKVGAIQDLLRGVEKILPKAENAVVTEKTAAHFPEENRSIAPLLERAFMFLEDGEWESADEYCERVLDMDPKNTMAYIGKLLAGLEMTALDDLVTLREPFHMNNSYQKAVKFADSDLREKLQGMAAQVQAVYEIEQARRNEELAKQEREKQARIQAEKARRDELVEKERSSAYEYALNILEKATTVKALEPAIKVFGSLNDYRDAEKQLKNCFDKAKTIQNDINYNFACTMQERNSIADVKSAQTKFHQLASVNWRDSRERAIQCEYRIQELKQCEQLVAKREKLNKEYNSLGIFSGKRKKEVELELQTIDLELKRLKY